MLCRIGTMECPFDVRPYSKGHRISGPRSKLKTTMKFHSPRLRKVRDALMPAGNRPSLIIRPGSAIQDVLSRLSLSTSLHSCHFHLAIEMHAASSHKHSQTMASFFFHYNAFSRKIKKKNGSAMLAGKNCRWGLCTIYSPFPRIPPEAWTASDPVEGSYSPFSRGSGEAPQAMRRRPHTDKDTDIR